MKTLWPITKLKILPGKLKDYRSRIHHMNLLFTRSEGGAFKMVAFLGDLM